MSVLPLLQDTTAGFEGHLEGLVSSPRDPKWATA